MRQLRPEGQSNSGFGCGSPGSRCRRAVGWCPRPSGATARRQIKTSAQEGSEWLANRREGGGDFIHGSLLRLVGRCAAESRLKVADFAAGPQACQSFGVRMQHLTACARPTSTWAEIPGARFAFRRATSRLRRPTMGGPTHCEAQATLGAREAACFINRRRAWRHQPVKEHSHECHRESVQRHRSRHW